MSNVKKWMTYLSERSPLPAISFLSAGMAVSSMAFTGEFNWWYLLLGLVINNIIFIQMRLGDELKDFENDKIINPERPLPRGLLHPPEVLRVLKGMLVAMILVGIVIAIAFNSWSAGAAIIATTLFAWLMFKEFYIGQGLAKSPLIYALTHQVIVFPLFGWMGLMLNPELIKNPAFIGWLLANFGASFTFEICRKLNPAAHKLANTYAHHYGRPQTVMYIAIFILYSAFGAKLSGFLSYSLPALVILFLSLLFWIKRPEKYKIPAALSALSSAIILWSPAIMWLLKRWS